MSDLAAFREAVGAPNVLTGSDAAPYLTDWTGAYRGAADAVVRPRTTGEVAATLGAARALGLPVTVQGGNTSVSGGSVPGQPGGIVLSLARLDRIRAVDRAARTATVEAGVVLQTLQEALAVEGLDFPLMFGARGSAMIGGALATNAGGANVLRHGNARDLCLGLEAVLPDGTVMHGLSGLLKDNTGYDLRHLLIGAEGTLGVITAAVLKLVPAPKVRATAFLALSGLDVALEVLNALQDASGGLVEAFEWMPAPTVAAILARDPTLRAPLPTAAETGILVELASTRADDAATDADGAVRLEAMLLGAVENLMARDAVLDGTVAASGQQREGLWAVRDAVLETLVAEGPFVSFDASLPLSCVPDFVARATPLAEEAGLRPLPVGHLGDGNIHFAVVAAPGRSWDAGRVEAFSGAVFDLLAEYGGSYSAEHGIGRAKAPVLAARKDPAQLDAMRRIKAALDPDGLLNPGVLFGP
jgi:FAD/FMN-containing dehydrogenase